MTVKELIDELKKRKPDAVVMYPSGKWEACNIVSVGKAKKWNAHEPDQSFWALILNDDEPRR